MRERGRKVTTKVKITKHQHLLRLENEDRSFQRNIRYEHAKGLLPLFVEGAESIVAEVSVKGERVIVKKLLRASAWKGD